MPHTAATCRGRPCSIAWQPGGAPAKALSAIQDAYLSTFYLPRAADMRPTLHIGEVISKPHAFAVGAIECILQFCLLRFEVLGGRMGTAIDLGDDAVQIGFDLACVFNFVAQMPDL